MANRQHIEHLETKVKDDPEFAWSYIQELHREAEIIVKVEQERIATALFEIMQADVTEIEALDQECPDDEPVDLSPIAGAV